MDAPNLQATQCQRRGQAIESFKPSDSAETGAHESLLPWLPPPDSRYNSLVPSVSQTVRVRVLFFGRLKDVVGRAEESLDITDPSTIEQLFALYCERIPELAKYRSSVVASRNQEFAVWDVVLHSGDEVAFLPPVSGG